MRIGPMNVRHTKDAFPLWYAPQDSHIMHLTGNVMLCRASQVMLNTAEPSCTQHFRLTKEHDYTLYPLKRLQTQIGKEYTSATINSMHFQRYDGSRCARIEGTFDKRFHTFTK
jgi:hypothetical protein